MNLTLKIDSPTYLENRYHYWTTGSGRLAGYGEFPGNGCVIRFQSLKIDGQMSLESRYRC